MTAVVDVTPALHGDERRLADAMVRWLETGERPVNLFDDHVFADLTLPHWHLQAEGSDAAFRLREDSHPHPGTVSVGDLDQTSRGFLLSFEARWEADGQGWYSREMMHCVVTQGRISELHIYCTGDWDESLQRRHADEVRLIRP